MYDGTASDAADKMLCTADVGRQKIDRLAARFGLSVEWLSPGAEIATSYWGAPEAGIRGKRVYVRGDTPLHSFLHEACHIVCMTDERRSDLDRDAGGDDLEESAVCYLQIILADYLYPAGAARLMADMDSWGYSFRLGSTAAWFAHDAEDAQAWLVSHNLLTSEGNPLFRLRGEDSASAC